LFAAVVHGDIAGAETLRRILVDWAADMHLIPAGPHAALDGYIGYFEPYATSHEALDQDHDFQAETRNVVLALCEAVKAQRAGRLVAAGQQLRDPRPK
jgi:hypothetical protein